MKLIILLLIFSHNAFAAVPKSIEILFERLRAENREVGMQVLKINFKEQALKGSKANLYPTLNLTNNANDAEKDEEDDSSENSNSTSSDPTSSGGSDAMGGKSQSTSNVNTSNKGWGSQLSLDYVIFRQFSFVESIQQSRNSLIQAELSKTKDFESKKTNLLQLLLEWQHLNELIEPISKAQKLVENITNWSKKNAKLLYTEQDSAELNERKSKVNYYFVKVTESQSLVEALIRDLIPSITTQEIMNLKKINIEYKFPEKDLLKNKFVNQSSSRKIQDLDVESSESHYRVSYWTRPWVPTIYSSLSYSKTGNYKGEQRDNGLSGSVLMRFDVFDGFYADARRAQAQIALDMSIEKRELETEKKVLFLKYQRMNALIKKAEFDHKNSIVLQKLIQLKDIEQKIRNGVGTNLEFTLSSLDYSQSKLEAIDSMKEYHKSSLEIATELNETGKVQIYEMDR